jgi:hypothetical protein
MKIFEENPRIMNLRKRKLEGNFRVITNYSIKYKNDFKR